MKKIQKLVFEFTEKFTKAKREKNIIDFNDIEHLALKILVDENEEPTAAFFRLCDELSKKLDDTLSHTTLPDEMDQDKIDEFVMNVNKSWFLKCD